MVAVPVPRGALSGRLGRALTAGLAAPLLLVARAPGGLAGTPDPLSGGQWNLQRIGAPAAWATATGRGITVAVVDTGVDLDHEDLRAKVVGEVACLDTGGDPANCAGSGDDRDGHGTHVAGIVGAATGNGRGVAGVAPDARILAVRVLGGPASTGSVADVEAGIRWAWQHGADVINLSLGELLPGNLSGSLEGAVEAAWRQRAVPVVAAGNDVLFPSGYGSLDAVVVTGTTRTDHKAAHANSVADAKWGLAAPGGGELFCEEGVLSTYLAGTSSDCGLPDGYEVLSGTSMAAPHVSGALAVLLSAGLARDSAIRRLLDTAADLGDGRLGAGRVDLAAAVAGLPAPAPGADPDDTGPRSSAHGGTSDRSSPGSPPQSSGSGGSSGPGISSAPGGSGGVSTTGGPGRRGAGRSTGRSGDRDGSAGRHENPGRAAPEAGSARADDGDDDHTAAFLLVGLVAAALAGTGWLVLYRRRSGPSSVPP
jgi:serine protease